MSTKNTNKETENKFDCNKGLTCGVVSPGPNYDLRPIFGYKDHCASKVRNPAFTIPKAKLKDKACTGPGPQYYYKFPCPPGFTIPRAVYKDVIPCSPGPKYDLPKGWSPAYSIVGRPKPRCPPPVAGPYDPSKLSPGPKFTFGMKPKGPGCNYDPEIRNVGPITLIRPCAPRIYLTPRRPINEMCKGPGPKYSLPIPKGLMYSFGVKHHKCSLIPITECDDLC